MANTYLLRQTGSARTQAFGLGVAVLVHLAILAGLVASVRIPELAKAPAIRVSLVPPPLLMPTEKARPPPPPAPEPAVQPRQARIVGPERAAPLPLPAAPLDAAARDRLLSAPFAASHEPVREGLRTSAGCPEGDFLKLSPAEREKCRQRNHALGEGAPTYAVGPSNPSQRAWLDKQAAKNDAHRRALEAPPSPAMTGCPPDSRFSNLGFSCTPGGSGAHIDF